MTTLHVEPLPSKGKEASPLRQIPVANTDRALGQALRKVFHERVAGQEPVFLYTKKACIDYLIYETPDLILINFADPKVNQYALLSSINEDRWLNCAGIVALHDMREDEFLRKVSGANIVAALHVKEIPLKLPRILSLIETNRNILFQRELQGMFTGEIAGSFSMENDLLDVQVHANLIANFVFNAGHTDETGKQGLKLALHEMLINAVEHGNCGITFDEKTRITSEGLNIADVIQEKIEADPSIAAKRVTLGYRVSNERTSISIRDEGAGFDWRARILDKKPPKETLFHGRGIQMSRNLCDNLRYNESGNEVSFDFRHLSGEDAVVPGFFEEDARQRFARGQVIFRRGEVSNFLYYIASGSYHVQDENGGILSTLTPSDAFLGEMSFLLANRRTATIVAAEEGVLYRIAKNRFIQAMQKSPYYAFFLCKLLARRLERANHRLIQQPRPSLEKISI